MKTKFTAWFNKQGILYFSANEVYSYFSRTRDGVANSPPPEDLWARIVPTLKLLDQLRAHINEPITLLSTYRSPVYNRAVGGEIQSFHMRFMAVDFVAKTKSPKQLAAILKKWRGKGIFTGGIGTYPGFVHVDTRNYNATW